MTVRPKRAPQAENSLTAIIRDVMAQIRVVGLAGTEVFSKIQQEAFKLLESFFSQDKGVDSIRKQLIVNANKVTEAKSPEDFAELENIFEERVSRVLQQLKVPTQTDLRDLQKRLENLNKDINALRRRQKQ
jgi:poly(hydroxyalkanoate) granule-associated protein